MTYSFAAELDPIVQSISGKFRFLYRSSPNGQLTTEDSLVPWADAESIRSTLEAYRPFGGKERYARGRAANSLAAVYMCNGRLEDAFEAIKESEATFVEMLNDPMMLGDWVRPGLVAAHYNACLILYRAGDVGQNYALAQANLESAIRTLAEMRHHDGEKWEFLDDALKCLQHGDSTSARMRHRRAADHGHADAYPGPWNAPSEHTKSIQFPATNPPNTRVLLEANMVHDFVAVRVDSQLVAVRPTGARKQIEHAAEFLESETLVGGLIIEIPAVPGATTGAVTLRCDHIFNTISLRDGRSQTFAGFGMEAVQGSRLLRSLLG